MSEVIRENTDDGTIFTRGYELRRLYEVDFDKFPMSFPKAARNK